MEPADLEGLAEALYRESGLDPSEPASPITIARAVLGEDAVELVPRSALRLTRAKLARVGDQWRIFVKRPVEREELNFFVGHELAHWAMRREGARFDDEADEERAADYLAGCLVATGTAFRRAMRAVGEDLPELANVFQATQSCIALRLGEAGAHDLALVRPGLVRVRGQLSFVWPREEEIVRWARGAAPSGVVKTRLTDDPRRVVLFADEVDRAAESG